MGSGELAALPWIKGIEQIPMVNWWQWGPARRPCITVNTNAETDPSSIDLSRREGQYPVPLGSVISSLYEYVEEALLRMLEQASVSVPTKSEDWV